MIVLGISSQICHLDTLDGTIESLLDLLQAGGDVRTCSHGCSVGTAGLCEDRLRESGVGEGKKAIYLSHRKYDENVRASVAPAHQRHSAQTADAALPSEHTAQFLPMMSSFTA